MLWCKRAGIIVLILAGSIKVRLDAGDTAHSMNGELALRHTGELKFHPGQVLLPVRLPSLAKKAVAFFRISRS